MKRTKKSEQGFSLVELAIVMVIIGLIVAAVAAGKQTMTTAGVGKQYQRLVVPCAAAAMLHRSAPTNLTGCAIGDGSVENDGKVATVTAAGGDDVAAALLQITQERLDNDDYVVSSALTGDVGAKVFTITVGRP